MKTARFTNVVNSCGEPETHLLLTDPSHDRAFQSALKANRVMTVFQSAQGNKADHGEVGYEPGQGRQFLIFPRSLRAFADRHVVGIHYDLLESEEEEEAPPPAPKPEKHTKPKAESKPEVKPEQQAKAEAKLEPATYPKAKPRPKPKAEPKPKPKPKPKREPKANVKAKPKPSAKPTPADKIIPFHPPPGAEDASREVEKLKQQVRRAMKLLEDGKQVAAFNLLKEIAE